MEKSTKGKALSKKKRIIIISSAVTFVVLAAILLYFFVLKPDYEEAIANYVDSLADFNKTVSEYEDKKGQIEAENKKLNEVIDELQNVLSSGEKPYNPDTIPHSNSAINEGKIWRVNPYMLT